MTSWRASDSVANVERFVEHVHATHLPHAVIIDATASAELPGHYESWLARGINNHHAEQKREMRAPRFLPRSLRETARRHQGISYTKPTSALACL